MHFAQYGSANREKGVMFHHISKGLSVFLYMILSSQGCCRWPWRHQGIWKMFTICQQHYREQAESELCTQFLSHPLFAAKLPYLVAAICVWSLQLTVTVLQGKGCAQGQSDLLEAGCN